MVSDRTDSKKDSTLISTQTKPKANKKPVPKKPVPMAQRAHVIAEKKVKADIIAEAKDNAEVPTLALEGLEEASKSLTSDSRKILEFLITDAMNDDTGHDQSVTRSIKRACRRAQMTDKSGDEMAFFRHVTDPGFMKVVKDTGAALVGAHILPLVATLLNIAIEERKQWAMTACLKISGLLPTQYDIYQLKYENTHINNFSGEVNYGGKTDKELTDICAQVYDEPESEEVNSGD